VGDYYTEMFLLNQHSGKAHKDSDYMLVMADTH